MKLYQVEMRIEVLAANEEEACKFAEDAMDRFSEGINSSEVVKVEDVS
jgi:hypothetical protein